MGHSTILFFDGLCNLCNASVQFVIRHDKKGFFRFSALQSRAANTFLGVDKLENASSIILYMDGKVFQKSSAALKIARQLDGAWKLLYVFIIVPRPVRDWLYDFIARNRYKWFGKRNECMVPTKELKARFLD